MGWLKLIDPYGFSETLFEEDEQHEKNQWLVWKEGSNSYPAFDAVYAPRIPLPRGLVPFDLVYKSKLW